MVAFRALFSLAAAALSRLMPAVLFETAAVAVTSLLFLMLSVVTPMVLGSQQCLAFFSLILHRSSTGRRHSPAV